MKLTFVLLTVSFLHVSANGLSQNVSFSGKDVSMDIVFASVEKQTSYVFLFESSTLASVKPISLSVSHMPLRAFLDLISSESNLSFLIKKKSISVQLAVPTLPSLLTGNTNSFSNLPNSYSLKLDTDTAIDRTYVLRGAVLGIADAPLQDVSVVLERTKRGTLTSPSGEFVLRDIGPGDVISFSYIGYNAKRITVRELKYLEVKLDPATTELDAVQVEGYRVNSRRMSTSNIVTVRAADIEKQPVANPLQALQGKVPGLVVTATSGARRGGWNALIRGNTSLDKNSPEGPLYIIDGIPITVLTLSSSRTRVDAASGLDQSGIVPPGGTSNGQSPIYSINPEDIETISVLKGPDELAVYGSRGSNGVILITTKRGQPGKTKLDLSASTGLSFITKFYEMLNTSEYIAMRKEALKNDGLTPDNLNAYDLTVWDTTKYTNWQKVFWGGIGRNVEADMSISGGDKMTTFRVSANYSNYTPLNDFNGSDQRVTNQISLNHASLNRRLKVGINNYFSFAKTDLIELSGSALLPPNAPPIFDSNGKLNYQGWEPISSEFNFGRVLNPFSAKTTFINSQINLSYNFLKGLNLSGNFGYSQNNQNAISITTIASQNPLFRNQGSSSVGTSTSSRLIAEPQIEYRAFLGQGDFSAMLGGSYQFISQRGITTFGSGFVNDALLKSIENAPVSFGSNTEGQYKYAAIFGRITYNFKRKLLSNITARRDGSSRFANGRNFGNFYSLGLAYIFSEDVFIKRKFPFISLGKLRGAYGLTGGDRVPDYGYITRWARSSTSNATYNNSPVYIPRQHANPFLQWQVDRKLEFGIDLGLFKDKLALNIGWYRNRTGNQLLQFILPAMTGFSSISANFPALVQNQGWELMSNVKIVNRNGLLWTGYINGGFNRNKLVKFDGIETSPYKHLYQVGQPLNITKVLHYTGVDPQSGLYTVEDKNKDGKIDWDTDNSLTGVSDLYVYDLSVKVDGSIGTDINYKGFGLSLFFQYRIGKGRNAFAGGVPGGIANISQTVYDGRWKSPGDNAKYAKLSASPSDISYAHFINSDGYYSKANFVRLNNLAISYTFPSNICSRLGIRGLNAFARGQNLAVLTNYEGSDPEVMGFGGFPPVSTVIVGFKISL